jgi:uncharacterized SAM-binding protein YcdF (DUF218 family)
MQPPSESLRDASETPSAFPLLENRGNDTGAAATPPPEFEKPRRNFKKAKFLASVILLLVAGSFAVWLQRPTISEFVLNVLQTRFPEWRDNGNQPVAGVIALGGTFSGQQSPGARVLAAIQLAKRFPSARIVFSGKEETAGAAGADAAQMFMAAGISPERIMIEGRSRSTAENAEFSRALVRPEKGSRWILVTSAFHMPRAVGAFRAAGFSVEAYPVEYILTPSAGDAGIALKEIIALPFYRLTGRSDTLLPSP